MLENVRISSKLLIMVGIAVLGIAAVAFFGLSSLKKNLLEDRKSKLQELVFLARQSVEQNYQASKKAGLSDTETLERGQALLRALRFGKDDYFYALSVQGVVEVHPNPKVEGKNLLGAADSDGVYFTREQVELAPKGGGFVRFRFPRAAGGEPIPKIAYVTEFKPFNWAIGGGIYLDDIDAIFWSEMRWIGSILMLTLLVVGGMCALLSRSIVSSITGIATVMRRITSGETNAVIPASDRRDEIGTIAKSVEVFRDSMVEAALLRSEQDEQKKHSEVERLGLLGKMADEFRDSIGGSLDALAGAAVELRATSNRMSSAATEASGHATDVAAAAEHASVNVETVAAAAEELSSSVSEIGRQVAESTRISQQAVDEASRTNGTVQGLAEAAQKIGDVIKLISDIASQTNLLALNATIEAARAGDAGRGFAVVASEVKSLASQTANATEDISAQVTAMQEATREAVQAIEHIGSTIGGMNEITTAIASAVEEQGSATREIARNVQEAARGTNDVSGKITVVTRTAGETGAAAAKVLSSAEQLNDQAALLRSNIDGFLANIRTA